MARFHINNTLRKNLEYFGQEKAKKLAQEARERVERYTIFGESFREMNILVR